MPTIPLYNQNNTEEAALSRAKRRVIKLMETGLIKLTERPDVDETNGKADDVANQLIRQMEDLTAVLRSTIVYFEERNDDLVIDNRDDVRKVLKYGFTIAKFSKRIAKITRGLAPNIRYLDLGVYSDLRTAVQELFSTWEDTFVYLTAVQVLIDDNVSEYDAFRDVESEMGEDDDMSDVSSQASTRGSTRSTNSSVRRNREAFGRLGAYTSFPDLVMRINGEMNSTYNILMEAVANFNVLRQQRVLPPEQIGTERDAVLSGAGRSNRPIYRIGNNQDERLYELAGLPRFI
jgi:hypothetical protein